MVTADAKDVMPCSIDAAERRITSYRNSVAPNSEVAFVSLACPIIYAHVNVAPIAAVGDPSVSR